MLKKFEEHIIRWNWKQNRTPILIACSGGIDSMTLVHLCDALDLNFALAHCNYNLRGPESKADEDFVRRIGENLGKEVFVKSFDIKQENKKGSIQMTARELRYQWFDELVTQYGFKNVLTGHHSDDSLETFLINLSRGTGLAGLTGIPEENGFTIRPLLIFSREEIRFYAEKNNLEWREDNSNSETKYLRNKIRHEVVPSLKKLGPQFLQNFEKTSKHLSSSEELLKRYKKELQNELFAKEGNIIRIDLKKLKDQRPNVNFLHLIFSEFGFTQWEDMLHLIDAKSGKEIHSGTHRLLKDRDVLLLKEASSGVPNDHFLIQESDSRIITPLKLDFEVVENLREFSTNTIYIDKAKLHYPLILRKRKKGDWFFPFGMKGKKKLSKFFKDEKVDQFSKEKVWLLCSQNDIVWVVGHRADNRFRVEKETQQILRVKIG